VTTSLYTYIYIVGRSMYEVIDVVVIVPAVVVEKPLCNPKFFLPNQLTPKCRKIYLAQLEIIVRFDLT